MVVVPALPVVAVDVTAVVCVIGLLQHGLKIPNYRKSICMSTCISKSQVLISSHLPFSIFTTILLKCKLGVK